MIYLDNAATTFPKPEAVYEHTFRFIREAGGNPGRGGHSLSVAAGALVEDTRRAIARFFGVADPRRVVFTAGCTDSLNMVLNGWLEEGDHVIASTLDHNAVSRPLEFLQTSGKISVSRVPFGASGLLDPQDILAKIDSNTKLIVLTHGSNVLGSLQPLPPVIDIARSRHIPVLLDAAQTAGRIEILEDGAPLFIACAAHKGLYGLPGLGILTVPPGFELKKGRMGGTGTVSESLVHPGEMPMRLEAGTLNSPAIASVKYGLEYIRGEGRENIHRREMLLARRLVEFLSGDSRFALYSPSGSGEALPVVAFNLKGVAPQEVAEILDQTFGIAVRAGLHCAAVVHQQLGTTAEGSVRVSPGYLNTSGEIETLVDALRQIAEGYSSR